MFSPTNAFWTGERFRFVLAVLAMVLALATPANAEPTAADKETARTLMAEGRARRDQKDLRGALESFQAAEAIMHVPTTAYEVASTQVALGQLVEARETLLRILRSPVAPGEPAPFSEARRRADALDGVLAQRIPSLSVRVESVPEGVALQATLDGNPIAVESLGIARRLNPGRHLVAVTAGSAHDEADVTLAPGETRTVTLQLSGASPSPSSATSLVEPTIPQQDNDHGTKQRRPVQAVTWLALGVTGAAIAVGSVTGVLSLSATANAKAGCVDNRCPPETHAQIDRAKTLGTASTIAFGVAGAGAAAALVTFLMRPAQPAESSAAWRPVLGPAFVGVTGAF